MSTSQAQWADLATPQENKRRCVDTFVGQANTDVDEQQPEPLSPIQRAIEQERHRIAEDLHDSVAQDVALALHKLEYVQHLLEQSQLYQAFQEVIYASRTLENGMHNLRASIEALLPRQFHTQTGFTSLMTLIQEYREDHPELQLDCQFEPPRLLAQLPSELEIPIFRFVQQALTNVWQHASASYVVIYFRLMSNALTIEVCDDGCGFFPEHEGEKPSQYKQLGLRIMRERVEHMHGTWKIKSQPGEGTSVYASFPLDRRAYTR